MGNENPGTPIFHTAPEFKELVPSCIVLYVHRNPIIIWLIRDGGRMGWGARAQPHLPVHTTPELQVDGIFFHGALGAHEP